MRTLLPIGFRRRPAAARGTSPVARQRRNRSSRQLMLKSRSVVDPKTCACRFDHSNTVPYPVAGVLAIMQRLFIFTLALLLPLSAFTNVSAQSLTCRTDSFGNTRCSDGTTYRTDSFGTTRDNQGNSWRTDSFGTTRGSDGSTYRTDRFGTTRDNRGNSWRTDSFGTTRGSDGTTCRSDSFGTMRCN